MAVRRDVMLELGGFDELFGPGARFMSADDVDVAVRVLLRGWHVYTTGDRRVVHHGFRTLREGRDHAAVVTTSASAPRAPNRSAPARCEQSACRLGVLSCVVAADRRRART